MELRCDSKLHGVLHDGLVEVKCGSKFCGSQQGVVVIHRFDPITGELVETKLYRDTPIINNHRKVNNDGMGQRASVRPA